MCKNCGTNLEKNGYCVICGVEICLACTSIDNKRCRKCDPPKEVITPLVMTPWSLYGCSIWCPTVFTTVFENLPYTKNPITKPIFDEDNMSFIKSIWNFRALKGFQFM